MLFTVHYSPLGLEGEDGHRHVHQIGDRRTSLKLKATFARGLSLIFFLFDSDYF